MSGFRLPTKAEWATTGRWLRDHAPAFTVSFVTFSALWLAVCMACLTLYVWDSKFYSSLAPPGMELSFMAAGLVFRTFVIFGGLAIVWLKTNKLNKESGWTLRFIWVMGLVACGIAALGFVTEGNDYHFRSNAAITQTETATTDSADTIIARATAEKEAIRKDRDGLVAAARQSMNLVLDDGNSRNDDVSTYEANIAKYQTDAEAKLAVQDAVIAKAESERLSAKQTATAKTVGDPALPAVFRAPSRYISGFDGITFRDIFAIFWVILLEACGSVGAQSLLAVQMALSKRKQAQQTGAKGGQASARAKLRKMITYVNEAQRKQAQGKTDLSEEVEPIEDEDFSEDVDGEDDDKPQTPKQAAE